MKLNNLKFYIIFFLIAVLVGGLILAPYTLNKQDGLLYYAKQLVPEKLKLFIKKNFLGKELLEKKYNDLKVSYEKSIKDDYILNVSNIIEQTSSSNIESKNNILYSFREIYLPFKSQKSHGGKPGGYLEKYNDKLIIASGDAKFISININQLENNEVKINLINNNFRKLLKIKKFFLMVK